MGCPTARRCGAMSPLRRLLFTVLLLCSLLSPCDGVRKPDPRKNKATLGGARPKPPKAAEDRTLKTVRYAFTLGISPVAARGALAQLAAPRRPRSGVIEASLRRH